MNFSVNNIQPNYQKAAYNKSKPVTFGNSNSYANDDDLEMQNAPTTHFIRNAVKFITGSALSIVGFNAALYLLQDKIGPKFLNKVINHYSKKIDVADTNKFVSLAEDMRATKKLNGMDNFVQILPNINPREAYYTHVGNFISVGEKNTSALFHELGHATIENKTKFLRALQRGRGRGNRNYNMLAFGLYALVSQNKNNSDGSTFSKFVNDFSTAIPLLAYAPELITEGAATRYGLKYLKSIRKDVLQNQLQKGVIKELPSEAKMISKELYKNIKRNYLACFCTYLLTPLSLVIVDKLDDWAHRRKS